MMSKNNDIAELLSSRLESILKLLDMNQTEFGEHSKIKLSTLSNYLTAKGTPDTKTTKLFDEAGINIAYIVGNEEYKKFADNTKGRLLANKYELKPYENHFNKRFESWIIVNYDNVTNFCAQNNLSEEKIYFLITKYLWEKDEIDYVKSLSKYGLNVKWLYKKSTNMYADNKAGEDLRKKSLGIDKIELQNNAIEEFAPIIAALNEKLLEYTAK